MIDWNTLVIGPAVAIFGEPVAYQPMKGAPTAGLFVLNGLPFTVAGVFDAEYMELQPISIGDLVGIPSQISSARPVLGVQLSQFPVPPAQGDQLTVLSTGQLYMVQEVRPDSHGAAKLLLQEAS